MKAHHQKFGFFKNFGKISKKLGNNISPFLTILMKFICFLLSASIKVH